MSSRDVRLVCPRPKAIVTCDAAGFQMHLINTAVQLIIVFNPAFYPSILFGGYLVSISGRGRRYTLYLQRPCRLWSPVRVSSSLGTGFSFSWAEVSGPWSWPPTSISCGTSVQQLSLLKIQVQFLSLPFIGIVFFTGWRGIVELPLEGIRWSVLLTSSSKYVTLRYVEVRGTNNVRSGPRQRA